MLIENIQKFIVFLLYGSLVAQAFIVLANPTKVNKRANLFFGFFLFFWSSYWLINVVALCELPINNLLIILVNSLQILTPVFLYFIGKYAGDKAFLVSEIQKLNSDQKERWKKALALLPVLSDIPGLFEKAEILDQHCLIREVFKHPLTYKMGSANTYNKSWLRS